MFKLKTKLLVVTLIMLSNSVLYAAEEFPLRKEYSELSPISTEQLIQEFDKYMIIDVRSKFEYDVIHMTNAKHVPVSQTGFEKQLETLRNKTGKQPIVFYCNGITCAKSYKACRRANTAGFKNVFVYDAGIFNWVNAQPQKAILLGETPVKKEKIIAKSLFKNKLISFEDFKKKALQPNTVVIDVRDPYQKQDQATKEHIDIPPISGVRPRPISMDKLLGNKILEAGRFKENQLLIYDAVGKQVRWLQYHLEHNGYKNYFFLKDGVRGSNR